MKRFSNLAAVALFGLALSSCTPEEVTINSPDLEGFSTTEDLSFSDREYAVLKQELNISQTISTPVVEVPVHLSGRRGERTLTTTSSDARKALLGRVLFYDTALSATGETSCASCHLQDKAFADPKAFSDGINGAVTKRNSIALGSVPTFAPSISGYGSSNDGSNAAVEGRVKFFWDERAGTVKEQSELTIQDELEMGKDLHELSAELRNREIYKILSVKAYGTTDLTPDRITLALEKFTSSITSMNTRFDQLQDLNFTSPASIPSRFTESELRGSRLFNQNCASCHSTNFAEPNVAVANNGLDQVYADKGVMGISGQIEHDGVFKVPFLRNVALTAPYMHDGRFETLREVIDHYSSGIQEHRNLHPNLKNGDFSPRQMNFSERDKQALIDFLHLPTDETIATNEELSDPF